MMLKFSSLTRKQSVFQKTNPQMVRDGEAFSWSMVGYPQVLAFKESMSCVEQELLGGDGDMMFGVKPRRNSV